MRLLLLKRGFHLNSQFDYISKKHLINLNRKIGDSISIIRYSDTTQYYFSYNKKTKLNTILNIHKDTLFHGSANKTEDYYLLNDELENGNFRIFAIRLTDSTITNLESEWEQGYLIDELIESKQMTVGYIDSIDYYLLTPSKKLTKSIFNKTISLVNQFKTIKNLEDIQSDLNEELNQFQDSTTNNNHNIKVYPNPFKEKMFIDGSTPITHPKFELRDVTGLIKKSGVLSEGVNEIDVTDLDADKYYIYFPSTEQKQLIVKEKQ